MRSESGYRWLRESSTSGPDAPICSARRSPTATTAAAPSPNSALPTRVAIDGSVFGISEHSSTASSTATPSGCAAQVVVQAAPCPAAPATQPSPNSGTRRTSGRSPIRPAIRASSVGTASPVTVVVMIRSTSDGSRPASSSAPSDRGTPEFDCVLDEHVVGGAEVGEPGVVLQRQHHVPAVDLRAPVHGADEVRVLREAGHRQQCFGHLGLGIAVFR